MKKKVLSVLGVIGLALGLSFTAATSASAWGGCAGDLAPVIHQNGSTVAVTVQVYRAGAWRTVSAGTTACGSAVRYTSWASDCTGSGMQKQTGRDRSVWTSMVRSKSYSLPYGAYGGAPIQVWTWCHN